MKSVAALKLPSYKKQNSDYFVFYSCNIYKWSWLKLVHCLQTYQQLEEMSKISHSHLEFPASGTCVIKEYFNIL